MSAGEIERLAETPPLVLALLAVVLLTLFVLRSRHSQKAAEVDIEEPLRKYIDERAQHKAGNIMAPIAIKVQRIERDVKQLQGWRDEHDRAASRGFERIASLEATRDSVKDWLDRIEAKLDRVIDLHNGRE